MIQPLGVRMPFNDVDEQGQAAKGYEYGERLTTGNGYR
jgi:hypothetical protein